MGLTKLVIRGARQHNLKNIDVEIPRNSLTVITGLSGSGKSSLAFDTIYAEGQRRIIIYFAPDPQSPNVKIFQNCDQSSQMVPVRVR